MGELPSLKAVSPALKCADFRISLYIVSKNEEITVFLNTTLAKHYVVLQARESLCLCSCDAKQKNKNSANRLVGEKVCIATNM